MVRRSERPRGAHRRGRRRRGLRWGIAATALLLVLFVGGPELVLWSSAPVSAKDCQVGPAPDALVRAASQTSGTVRRAAYPGGLEQTGGAVTDAGCLTRTPVHGVARPRDEAGVRAALAYAHEHGLAVSVGGTQHAMGGQASYPGGLVVDMRGMDAITVDEESRTAVVQAGATWHQVLEAVHPAGLAVATMPGIDVLSVGGTVSVNAHGLDFRAGSLSSTIASVRVMLADGSVHRAACSRRPSSTPTSRWRSPSRCHHCANGPRTARAA